MLEHNAKSAAKDDKKNRTRVHTPNAWVTRVTVQKCSCVFASKCAPENASDDDVRLWTRKIDSPTDTATTLTRCCLSKKKEKKNCLCTSLVHSRCTRLAASVSAVYRIVCATVTNRLRLIKNIRLMLRWIFIPVSCVRARKHSASD